MDLLRADAALHMPMDVDGACMSGPKGKERRKVPSADVNHELVDSCDRSRHCNERTGFENHCLGVTER